MNNPTIDRAYGIGTRSLATAQATLCEHCNRRDWDTCRVGALPTVYAFNQRKHKVCDAVAALAQTISGAVDTLLTEQGEDISKLAKY